MRSQPMHTYRKQIPCRLSSSKPQAPVWECYALFAQTSERGNDIRNLWPFFWHVQE